MANKFGKDLSMMGPDDAAQNIKLNISMRMQEKLGIDPMAGYEENYHSPNYGDGWEEILAPTSNSGRPRAINCAYHHKANLLVICFRPPTRTDKKGRSVKSGESTWIVYLDTSLDMWDDLKGAQSTGRWLLESGIESNEYYPVDKAKLDEIIKDIASSNAQ